MIWAPAAERLLASLFTFERERMRDILELEATRHRFVPPGGTMTVYNLRCTLINVIIESQQGGQS